MADFDPSLFLNAIRKQKEDYINPDNNLPGNLSQTSSDLPYGVNQEDIDKENLLKASNKPLDVNIPTDTNVDLTSASKASPVASKTTEQIDTQDNEQETPAPKERNIASALAEKALDNPELADQIQQATTEQPAGYYSSDLNDVALKQAQVQAGKQKTLGMLADASSAIGSALSKGAAPDIHAGKEVIENSDTGVKNIIQRREAADKDIAHQKAIYDLATDKDKSDPNSQVSKVAQNFISSMSKKAGMDFGDVSKMSLASLEKFFGPMQSYFSHIDAADARRDAAASKKDQKNQEQVMKYNKFMGEDLDPTRARSGSLGKSQQVVNDTQSLEALAHNYTNLDKVPPAQYAEMAASLDRLVSRGNPSIERFRHLMPNNVSLTGSNVLQWIASKPVGANQGQFIKSILNTAQAERDTAKQQILDAQIKKAYSTHSKYKDLSPDDFYNTLSNATGLSVDELKQREQNKGKTSETSTSNDMVKVISPEGQEGLIPKENLEKAKKRGFKEAP